jgi:hypothetical protein
MSTYREKITLIHKGKIHTFDQYAEGESSAEFTGRARHAVGMTEGDEYYEFTQRGHHYHGPVSECVLGHKREYVRFAQDKMLPGLYLRRGKKVYDYRDAPASILY